MSFTQFSKKFLISLIALLAISSTSLLADHRNFVWTYEYMILEPNNAELETYQTYQTSDVTDFKNTTSNQLNLEFEIGMAKFWDAAIYQTFSQSPGGSLHYDGFKIRNRFKIGEKNQFFLDPLIYIEYESSSNFSKHVIEPKLILAKTIGDFSFSLNPYVEFEKEESEWEVVPKYALGATYGITPIFNAGLEFMGDKDGNYFGPTISHGSPQFWFALGTLFKLGKVTAGHSEFQARMIMGFEL